MQCEGNELNVCGLQLDLKQNVVVLAFGKAVLGMVEAVEDVLGDHIRAGIASVPLGSKASVKVSYSL